MTVMHALFLFLPWSDAFKRAGWLTGGSATQVRQNIFPICSDIDVQSFPALWKGCTGSAGLILRVR